MNTFFAYTRVSTVRQGEQGSSLQEQKNAIELYARRNNLTVSTWFEEMETAAKQGRRVFNKMVGELKKGRAAGVIIHKIDRSARNLRDWAQLGELIDAGIAIHFAHESVDLLSRGGRLSADIQAVVAADYVRNLRDEVRKGFRGRVSQGVYPLGPPIGYLPGGKGKPKPIDPFKGPLVRQVFELYDTGRFSLDDIRLHMQTLGLTTSRGAPLSKSTIGRMVRNPFYAGFMRMNGAVHQGIHEPLISMALFDRVQVRLTGRRFPHVVVHRFVYRRLIKCGACGRSLTGERQKGHVYYRCHLRTCRRTSIREKEVDDALRATLAAIALSKEDFQDFRDFVEELRARSVETANVRTVELKRNLALCEERLSRLTDALLDAHVDADTFNQKKDALLLTRARLREELEQPAEASPLEGLVEKFELGNTAQLRFDSEIEAEKRETVEFISSNLTVHGKNLEITPRFPFSEVIFSRPVPSSGVDRPGLRTWRPRSTRRQSVRSVLRRLAHQAMGDFKEQHNKDQNPRNHN